MKLPAVLALGALAACGGPTGAILTVTSTPASEPVDRLEVLMTTADPAVEVAARPGLSNVGPDGVTAQSVAYLHQATPALAPLEVPAGWASYAIELSPDASARGATFVPVVLGYQGDRLVAAGVYRPAGGEPEAIRLLGDGVATYAVALEAVDAGAFAAASDAPLGDGQATEVRCPAAAPQDPPWRSGVAWQPAGRSQLRVVLEAPDGALAREADLDCDASLAAADAAADCDDLRADVRPGADEACDGRDTDCDGAYDGDGAQEVQDACPLVDGCKVYGRCDDRQARTTCSALPEPQCDCALRSGPGSAPTTCKTCHAKFEVQPNGTSDQRLLVPCHPQFAELATPLCSEASRCTVKVVDVDPMIDVQVADAGGAYADRAADVASIQVRVDRLRAQVGQLGMLPPVQGWFLLRIDHEEAGNTRQLFVEYRVQLDVTGVLTEACPARVEMTCDPAS